MSHGNEEFMFESLKNRDINGYLILTDAAETGEQKYNFILITSNTRPGVDIALMNAGFEFEAYNNLDQPKRGLFWMNRGSKENLRYFPIDNDRTSKWMKEFVVKAGMKTRIDFFCQNKSDAVFDVVKELLELGYKVVFFHERFILELDGKVIPI